MKQLVTENIIVDSTEIHAVKKGTLISNNTPLDPASLELIRISEYNDFIKVLRSVIERRFLTKSKLEMQAALLEPNKFLLDGDGLMITLLENKAKHIYNILRIIPGFISILKSKIIPIASIIHSYCNSY
jgi:hypothetical protein